MNRCLQSGVRCLSCKYDLSNLTTGGEHRCPECGREFDPNDPRSFETHDSRRRDALRRASIWAGSVYLISAIIVVSFTILTGTNPLDVTIFASLFVFIATMLILLQLILKTW